MGYFQVRYDSRVVIYDCRGFIRLATVSRLIYRTWLELLVQLANVCIKSKVLGPQVSQQSFDLNYYCRYLSGRQNFSDKVLFLTCLSAMLLLLLLHFCPHLCLRHFLL